MKLDRSYSFLDFHRFLPYVFFGLFLFLLGLVSFVYYSYIYAFFISGILFILFRTPHRYLLKKLNERRTTAAVISHSCRQWVQRRVSALNIPARLNWRVSA